MWIDPADPETLLVIDKRASDGDIGTVTILDDEQAGPVVAIEHIGRAHELFRDYATDRKELSRYLKDVLLSSRGYITRVNLSAGISIPHITR